MRILLALLVFMAGCGGCATLPPSKPTFAAATRLEFPSGGICSATAIGRHTLVSAAHCFSEPRGLVKVNATLAQYEVIADDKRDHVLVRVGSIIPTAICSARLITSRTSATANRTGIATTCR